MQPESGFQTWFRFAIHTVRHAFVVVALLTLLLFAVLCHLLLWCHGVCLDNPVLGRGEWGDYRIWCITSH